MNSVEPGAEGVGIEHITLDDFSAPADAGPEEFRATRQAAHTLASSLEVFQQSASDIPGGSCKEDQDSSM
jgi:hypothetical protein